MDGQLGRRVGRWMKRTDGRWEALVPVPAQEGGGAGVGAGAGAPKTFCQQTNFGRLKFCWREKVDLLQIVGANSFLNQKLFGAKNIFGAKKIGAKKRFDAKMFYGATIFVDAKKMLAPTKKWRQKIVWPPKERLAPIV